MDASGRDITHSLYTALITQPPPLLIDRIRLLNSVPFLIMRTEIEGGLGDVLSDVGLVVTSVSQ